MKKSVLVVSVCWTLLFGVAVFAQEITVLTEQYYPFNYTEGESNDGPVLGRATELVELVLAEAELDYTISVTPWARVIRGAETRPNVLVYSMARTQEREDRYHWVGEIVATDNYLYGLRENANSLPTSLEEAITSRIGVIRGGFHFSYLTDRNFENLIIMRSGEQNIRMLAQNRVDLIPLDALSAALVSKKLGFSSDMLLARIRISDSKIHLYMALSKSTDMSIVNRLQGAYAAVRNSGQYDSLMGPWIRIIEMHQDEIVR